MKVLCLSILAGMGHIKAAEAIAEGLKEEGLEPKNFIILHNCLLGWFINSFYLWMTRKAPALWALFYKTEIWRIGRWFLDKAIREDLQPVISEFFPDIVISTHPFISSAISTIKKRNFKIVPVATDFDCHPMGITPEIDLYIVPHQKSSEYLQKKGVSPSKIKVIGIPILSKFHQNKGIKKEKFGLSEKPIVLYLGGGYGLGHIEKHLLALTRIKDRMQIIIVAGKNARLAEKLKKRLKELGLEGKVLGFIDYIDELLEITDIAVGKAGGLGASEVVAKGVPLIITEAIPGQEEKNAEILIKEGLAVWPKDVGLEIERLITEDKARLMAMKDRMHRLKPQLATMEIARILKELSLKK
ncbi:MAG: glycosyltransferase [bacterium]|nr:glycosyltransferase [bacterium]